MTAPINPYRYRPEPTLTGPEAAAKAGIDYDIAKRLNRALGMPEIDDRSVEFGERDVEVLQILKEMISAGVPLDDVIAVARVYGQSFARIADAETRLFRDHFVVPMREQGTGTEEIEEHFEPLVTRQLDLLGKAIDYVHRRHLAVALLQLTTSQRPTAPKGSRWASSTSWISRGSRMTFIRQISASSSIASSTWSSSPPASRP